MAQPSIDGFLVERQPQPDEEQPRPPTISWAQKKAEQEAIAVRFGRFGVVCFGGGVECGHKEIK